jgi:putative selenium metabolism hydrolase
MPTFSFLGATPSLPASGYALSREMEESLTGFLQKLVQTPSHSAQEQAVADLIAAELRKLGITDVQVDRAGNVIARLGSGQGPVLLYDAHMDTVLATEARWLHAPYAAEIVDGVVYGLGACDMKGSLAAMVYGAARLVSSATHLRGTLVLAFVVQEEPCEGCALKVMLDEQDIRPDWVVLGEPSDLAIMRGHRGRVLFRVTVHGKSAHASSPELGRNAIAGAARLIFSIDLLAAELASDPFLGPGTIAVTHIESRAPSLNAIPDSCTFYVDRRLTLGETSTRAQTQIEAIVEREGIRATVEIAEYQQLSYTGYPIRAREAFNPWALEENHELVRVLATVVREVRGQSPVIGHWPFSTDGAFSMAEAGIPTIGFGPGNPHHAHTTEDQVRLADVAQAAQVYARLAATLLK